MHVIVPIKRYAHAKTRLAGVLAPVERARLARLLAETVLTGLAAARRATSVQVVSDEPALAQLCRPYGFSLLTDDKNAPGLNAAVERGLALARLAGHRRVAVVHADLPLFQASAFDAMADRYLAVPGPCTTIVTDMAGEGTNLLFTNTDPCLPCLYGRASASRHAAAARALGCSVNIVRCTPFSVDCDWPEDLRHLAAGGFGEPLSAAAGAA